MRIEVLKIKDLIPFIESELYKGFEELPITVLRAVSQANNPRASADDPALLIALNDLNEVTSYIGLLPDNLKVSTGIQKIFSNSCWWAKKDCKDNGAMQLFFAACKLTSNQMFFPELTPHTKKLLSNMKAFHVRDIDNGLCGYLKMDLSHILPEKKPYFSHFGIILSSFDFLINTIYKPILWSWKIKLSDTRLTYEIATNVDDDMAGFIRENNENELFQRNKNELNWILKYPWVTTGQVVDKKKYTFTSHVNSFKTIPVKVYNSTELVGCFLLLKKEGKMLLPYFYCHEKMMNDVLKVIYKLLLDNDTETFTSFHPKLNRVIQKYPHPFLHLRKRSKFIAYPTNLEADFASKDIQDGDGDCAFI